MWQKVEHRSEGTREQHCSPGGAVTEGVSNLQFVLTSSSSKHTSSWSKSSMSSSPANLTAVRLCSFQLSLLSWSVATLPRNRFSGSQQSDNLDLQHV